LNGGLGLFVLAVPGLLEQKRPDKLFFRFFESFFEAVWNHGFPGYDVRPDRDWLFRVPDRL